MNSISEFPKNKFAQLVVGIITIFIAVKLYWAGWFSTALFESTGVESAGYGTAAGIVPVLIDAVCFVGLSMMSIVSLVIGNIGPVVGGLAGWVADAKSSATPAPTTPEVDAMKLTLVLEEFEARLANCESELGLEFAVDPFEDLSREQILDLLKKQLDSEAEDA